VRSYHPRRTAIDISTFNILAQLRLTLGTSHRPEPALHRLNKLRVEHLVLLNGRLRNLHTLKD
jgi:hypothetical protein